MPRVWPLTSQVAFGSQTSGSVFGGSPAFWKVSQVVPRPGFLPELNAHFVPPFGVFSLGGFKINRQSHSFVLIHSSNRLPSG